MTTPFWQTIVAALLDLITSGSFSQFRSIFQNWFNAVIKDRQDPPIVVVGNKRKTAFMAPGDAPDDVKSALKQLILDLVGQAFAGRPILLRLITAFLSGSVLDGLIDSLWDKVFAAKIVAGEIQPSASFVEKPLKPTVKTPTPLTCNASEFKEAQAEAGIINDLPFNGPRPMAETTLTPGNAAAPKSFKDQPVK